jgi:hypothetical protein
MATTLVQATAALNLASTDPSVGAYPGNTVSGNYLYALMACVGTETVSGITDTQSNTWSQKGQYTTAGGNLEIWSAVAGSSAANTVTIDMTALPTGGSTFVLCEVSHGGTTVDGPSNTAAATTAADPLLLATLTTTAGGIIFAFARLTSNFALVGFGDGFASLHSGSTLGRGLFGYRITTGGVSAVPDADMSTTESADCLTIAFYDADPRQAYIFGRGAAADDKAKVTSDLTVLMNLDGLGRTVHEPNTLYVAGDMIVTGTTTFTGDVSVADPTTLTDSIVTDGSGIVFDSDGNVVTVTG